jgi:hypothetical protein
MVNDDTIYRRTDRVVSREIAGERILVPIRSNVADMESLFTLNEVGSRIFGLVDGVRTVRDLISAIVAEFEVGEAEASADVKEFVEKLLEIGSIEPSDSSSK